MLRTYTCGQLDQKFLEKEVILCGWVNSRRDHGKIIFIDLRDRYGVTQIFFYPKPHLAAYDLAKTLRSEDVVRIKGIVKDRPKGTENSKIVTGYIEVHAQEVEVLNRADDLPFMIDDNIDVSEEIRLTYRYLDLRRKLMQDNFKFRHSFNQNIRAFLNKKDFLEIETPFLTKSTPEGARDFLVPSRLNPGQFYALPQSPQLFKQLLMVSGMDRYYQIARCFRDEDLRKDRQPEFTQLDLEMSFVEQEDIFALFEELISTTFKEVLGIEIKTPFPRMTHKQAFDQYQSDKPDIGGEDKFRFLWVVDFPLFEYNDEEKKWQSCHHPFTAPHKDDIHLLDKFLTKVDDSLAKVRSCSYDLVLNGQEIGSGSIRIHAPELQSKIFSILGISLEEAERKFGFLLKAFRYGAPPHAGFAIGLDRLYSIITGMTSIRDVIAFPKTQRGICPLTQAPSGADAKQLKELYLKTIEE